MKLIKSLLLGSILLSTQTFATMPDELAGLTLGTKFDEKKENFISNDTANNIAYYEVNFEGFKKVSAIYSPKTRTIYQIGLMKPVFWKCGEKAKVVADNLVATFGNYKNYEEGEETAFIFEEGDRKMVVACVPQAKGYVVMTYGDKKLIQSATDESFK